MCLCLSLFVSVCVCVAILPFAKPLIARFCIVSSVRLHTIQQDNRIHRIEASCGEEIFLRQFYGENPLGNRISITALSCLNDYKPIYIVYRIKQTTNDIKANDFYNKSTS